jgi:drug/metabolite transporter (DMT)-like permease
MGLTSVALICLPKLWRNFKFLSSRIIFQLIGIGVLVTFHWITFYGSIKESNVSVALTCLATTSIFVSVLEPLLLKRRFIWHELILAIIIVPAIYLVFTFSGNYTTGILLGIASALLATIFSIFNKHIINKAHPYVITFVEIGTGFLLLCISMPIYFWLFPYTQFKPSASDLIYLIILAVACTVLPFTLSLFCMKHLSVFTASIILNLEPVYGILMAVLLFKDHQHLQPGFYIGSCIIISVVFINPFIQKRYATVIDRL